MAGMANTSRVREQVQRWRDELLDLTGHNRLLRFKALKSTLEVQTPSPQLLIDRLLSGRSRWWSVLVPYESDDLSDELSEERVDGGMASPLDTLAAAPDSEPAVAWDPMSTLVTQKTTARDVLAACAELSRRATQEFMDKGIWILYLGVGMLIWSDPADHSGDMQESPLLMVPVELVPEKGRDGWRLEPFEGEMVVNPALWLKLESELTIELPELADDDAIDTAAFLRAVRLAVADNRGWSVRERVVLSTFSFHKEAMYRDVRDNIDQIVAHSVVGALARDPGEPGEQGSGFAFEPVSEASLDTVAPAEHALTIRDADGSQRQCIAAAVAGKSFVMDGPPGTGKSQTIANIIAEMIGQGKTVLFVSEKAAALDVVHKRLDEAGLADYLLELHSHKTTRKAVATALGGSLRRRPRSSPLLTDAELVSAERGRDELTRYADALNEPLDVLGGRTLHHLLGLISRLQPLPQAPVAGRPLTTADELAAVRQLGARLASSWQVVERGEDFVWAGAAIASWDAAADQVVHERLKAAAVELAALREISEAVAEDLLLVAPAGALAAATLGELVDRLGDRPERVAEDWLSAVAAPELEAVVSSHAARIERHRQVVADAEEVLGAQWQLLSPDAGSCGRVWAELDELLQLTSADWTLSEVERLSEAARRVASEYQRLGEVSVELAVGLGLRATELTQDDGRELRELAGIAGQPERLDPRWLTSRETVESGLRALTQLEPLLASEQEARARAASFTPAALELDLVGLRDRFRDEHRGLKRLGGAYKSDRAALAATAPQVKPKVAVAQIDAALAWQAAHLALQASAADYERALGPGWRGRDTAVPGLREQLSRAGRVLSLTDGRIADHARLVAALAEAPPAALAPLQSEAEAIAASISSRTPEPLTSLCRGPLDEVASRMERAAALLESTVELMRPVDALRPAVTRGDAQRAHTSVAEAVSLKAEVQQDGDSRRVLGPAWSGLDADAGGLRASVAWSLEARRLAGGAVTAAAARRLVRAEVDGATLHGAIARWRGRLEQLLLLFDDRRRSAVAADMESRFDNGAARLAHLTETRGDIAIWIDHVSASEDVRTLGLGDALAYCVAHGVLAAEVGDVLLRSALEATADAELAARSAALGPLRSVDRERLVSNFASLDKKVVSNAAHRVMERANARRPTAIVGAAAILASEAEKKKRHMPVAELLRRAGDVAQAIKPCFMMSPLSVSQYLPPDMEFDLVIFDEASQVRPCDAVNALYRGHAMVVAGDDKQLPPSNFWQRSIEESEEWDEEEFAQVESVLGQSKRSGAFRSLSLRWHYRSRHEDLIAFSNHRFYGGQLVTFPSASETAPDLGVASFRVEGVYRRGTSKDNPSEAREVVDRVFTHAEAGQRSIGVVAFSEAQASLIESVLRRDRRYDEPRFEDLMSSDRLEGLFVKNLENVQGDEREIIIFSVGYGPDEAGKFHMNFGPVTSPGGWRRLNVAITRARSRVEIVSSFRPDALANSNNEGVDALRRYLEFAERGPASLMVADGLDETGAPESPFEESVEGVLRGWGHNIAAQVGTAGYRIDLAVRDPQNRGRFVIGIECDGAMYHSSRVARDRDRLREQVLVGLGWTLHRIWGPSWYRDRAGEERRLRDAIDAALRHDPGPPLRQAIVPTVVEFDELDPGNPPAWADPYALARLPRMVGRELSDPRASAELRRAIVSVVQAEGPIVEDLLMRRVLDAWGATSTDRRRGSIAESLAGLIGAGTVVINAVADGYSIPGQRLDLVRVPHADDERSRRDVREIPDVELGLALVRLVGDARVIERDEALRATARLFGWRRSGPSIAANLNRVIEQLLDDGRISCEDGVLRVSAGPPERRSGAEQALV
jgi:very-short-patch-repair endonuclease